MDTITVTLIFIGLAALGINTVILSTRVDMLRKLAEHQQKTIQTITTTDKMVIAQLEVAQKRLDILQAPYPPRQGPPVPLEIVRKQGYEQGL